MSIEYAVLGALSQGSLTGYELKKLMQRSPIMPWSGNSNQVYRALTALANEGLVSAERIEQPSLPAKKRYSITRAGRDALAEWARLPSDEMELRKPFLLKLGAMGELGARGVDEALGQYRRQLQMQLQLLEAPDPGEGFPGLLQRLVQDNVRMSYEAELGWADRARAAVAPYAEAESEQPPIKGGDMQMSYVVRNKYLYYPAPEQRPESVEPTQFIGDCIGERMNRILIDEGALPETFFRLSTGVAGELLQKLGQYHVKAALIYDRGSARGKFQDMLIEINRGSMFRSFESEPEAEKWLMQE